MAKKTKEEEWRKIIIPFDGGRFIDLPTHVVA